MKVQARPVLNLPEDVQTAEGWRDALAGLARDEAEMEAGLEAVRAERKALALDIARGEPAAVKRNAELNARQVELLNNLDLLLVVRGAAQEKLALAELAEAAVVADVRRAEARGLAEALVEQSERADAAFAELTAALSARGVLARRLAGYGGVSLNQLLNRVRLLAAATNAGLDGVLEIGRAPRHLAAPLREIDRTLLRELLPAGDPPAKPSQTDHPDPAAAQLGPIPRPAAPEVAA